MAKAERIPQESERPTIRLMINETEASVLLGLLNRTRFTGRCGEAGQSLWNALRSAVVTQTLPGVIMDGGVIKFLD